jgi:tetratricopeptide (TPR) repeat protein
MAGDGRLALKYADHAAVAFPASFDKAMIVLPPGVEQQAKAADRRATAEARGLVAYGRYAPARALALADAAGEPRVVRVYRHYARGEAFASRGDGAGVRREAGAVAALGAEAQKAGESGTLDVASIAGDVLAGRAALMTGQPAKAVELFAKAAARQEKAFPFAEKFDPPPWWYPVRRSLAAADLAAGKPDEAIREARASLAAWPEDALALKVLSQAEAKQGHAAEARTHMAQAKRAWRGDLAKVPLDLV